MRHAKGWPLRDLLSIDQRPHSLLSVVKRKPLWVDADGSFFSDGDRLVTLGGPVAEVLHGLGRMTLQQAIDNGQDRTPIEKMLRGRSLEKLESKVKKLLDGFSAGNIKDATELLLAGPCTGHMLIQVLEGRR